MESRRRKMALSRLGTALILASTGVLVVGCFERTLQPVNPCTRSRTGNNIRVTSVDEVDLLFMVDNSNSMAEEQASLAVELPRLVQVLASGDLDDDGSQDFQPVRSLHIGVITSDMGVGGGFTVSSCEVPMGDDGRLINTARTSDAACTGSYPTIFEFQRGMGDAMAFAQQVGCVARTGIGGCGFEQQLEAVLKASSPSQPQEWTIPNYVPPLFVNRTSGHADGANAGFIRPNSALAIIMVTDEEDCSASDVEIFNQDSTTYGGVDLNLRCSVFGRMDPSPIHPIERYIDGVDGQSGLLGLRQNPNLLIFAGIVGVPVESVPEPSAIDYDAILAHPLMQEMEDPTTPGRLVPSCNVPGLGTAFPPRRIVSVARGIEAAGGSATIQSICQDSFTGALDAIISKIASALGGACLPRELNTDAQGRVQCDVFEILPDGMSCEGLDGRTADGTLDVNGAVRQRCKVTQVGPSGAAAGMSGWWYETAENAMEDSNLTMVCPNGPRRIAFAGINPITNSEIRLECLQTILPGSATDITIGAFCDPVAATDTCASGSSPNRTVPLACDAAERTCAVPCGNTENSMLPGDTTRCTSAGLLGDVCDTRSWREVVGLDDQNISEEERARRMSAIPAGMEDMPHNFCVNPTCI